MTETMPGDQAPPIERLRCVLMGDPALQMQLAAIREDDTFVAAVLDIGRARDVEIDAEEIARATLPDPLGVRRFSGAPVTGRDVPLGDWLPTAIVPSMGELAIDWAHFAGAPVDRPFFEDSLRRARALPINRLLQPRTPLGALVGSIAETARAPDGIIFHQSRCGSTLVSQMLAADPRNIVISEAPAIDSVLQLAVARTDLPMEMRASALRAIVGAFGRDRLGTNRHFVAKLDGWHTIGLPVLRAAFPDTPWIFLYREPIEILVSHARMAGSQTVAGALPFDPYGIPEGQALPPDEFAARALGRVAEAVLDHLPLGGGIVVDYKDLPEAVEARILPHFGISLDEEGRAALRAASQRDAKDPGQSFAGDSLRKREEASESLRALALCHMAEPFRRLGELRHADAR